MVRARRDHFRVLRGSPRVEVNAVAGKKDWSNECLHVGRMFFHMDNEAYSVWDLARSTRIIDVSVVATAPWEESIYRSQIPAASLIWDTQLP